MNKKEMQVWIAGLAFGTILLASLPVRATLITITNTAPTVDAEDIANLDLTTAFGDFQTSVIWGDRPARGQTFLTGSNPGGYQLDIVTVKSSSSQNNNGTYTVRIGGVSGTDFTQIASETTGTITDNVASNDYVSFTLDTPVNLQANTLYGFDIGRSGSGWQLFNNDNTEYAGGQAYTTGADGVGGSTITTHNQDRIFHLNLIAIPEPSVAALVFVGAALLRIVHRFRHRST